ncbi:MAG: pirin family protein [Gammaproteobacteria bacterium]|jgi:redox-sensitive bicupin YhaK (pirin superfamily)|nr:pirin family protein [Gammaproteobacteria bacterium]
MAILLSSKVRDLDGLPVNRILPHFKKRMVGPFIFLDHMGPMDLAANEGLDVKPHPHIGLSTLTYLLEGKLLHQDSLGNNIEIVPGDVNLMTAGKGITHSEREPLESRSLPHRVNGIQCWLALPESKGEIEPSFQHISQSDLDKVEEGGVYMTLIAGTAFGLQSPVNTFSPLFLLDVEALAGSTIKRPEPEFECMLYILEGKITTNNEYFESGQILLLDKETSFQATTDIRCLLLGGKAWETIPFIEWNFVSFHKERIEQAKQDWRERRFPDVPGDSEEFTPLPN